MSLQGPRTVSEHHWLPWLVLSSELFRAETSKDKPDQSSNNWALAGAKGGRRRIHLAGKFYTYLILGGSPVVARPLGPGLGGEVRTLSLS